MKKHLRHLMVTVLLGGLLASQSALAGECCAKTAKATKAGKTCAACETQECCTKAAQQVADSGKAKPCKQCEAKKQECCTKAAKATRAGKTCAACEAQECCKKAAQQVADNGKDKPCKKCEAKKKEKSAVTTSLCPASESSPGGIAWAGF